MKTINIVLFDDFTTLDALGPAEVFSKLDKLYALDYCSREGGLIESSTRIRMQTKGMDEISRSDILLIPGGFGARRLVDDRDFLDRIRRLAEMSEHVLCVCTGSALLARTGLLDGRKATSNKLSWDWVVAQCGNVDWVRKARWIVDGKYRTSSGITAGIDMSLGYLRDMIGQDVAAKIARVLEYRWNEDETFDPFSE